MRWMLAALLAAVSPDLIQYILVLGVAAGLIYLGTSPLPERG